MDILPGILNTFSENEKKEFKHFLLRQKYSANRKDLKLLEELLSGKEKFSKGLTSDSYHGLRKRLIINLADYIIIKERKEDVSESGLITGWISLSNYFFRHSLIIPAWKYLLKAEVQAWKSDAFELLGTIYLLIIKNIHTNGELSLNTILTKQKKAEKLADEDRRMIISTALIRKRLEESKVNVNLEDFPDYVESIFEKYKLHEVILNRPAHLVHLLEIVRNTYLAMRELKNFEPFILEQYTRFKKLSTSRRSDHEYHLKFLYMISHVLFRNRKYKLSLKYLEKLAQKMTEYKGISYNKFYPRYISLVSFISSYTGKNDYAIELHERFISNKKRKVSQPDELNMQLNLAFFYFNARMFRKSNAVFLKFIHRDQWYEKIMGKEWILRKRLIQLIVQYELGNEDISIQILDQIQKEQKVMFDLPQYQKAFIFISLLRRYISDPFSLTFKEFHAIAVKDLFQQDLNDEESKAIAFYCWLKSKLTGEDYYKTLLAEVKR